MAEISRCLELSYSDSEGIIFIFFVIVLKSMGKERGKRISTPVPLFRPGSKPAQKIMAEGEGEGEAEVGEAEVEVRKTTKTAQT